MLINMEHHTGEHPRIGAADVVPFIPVSGVTMEDCVGLAKSFGARVASDLHIPVYLYEAAATSPDAGALSSHSAAAVSIKTMGRVPAGSQQFHDQNCACRRAATTEAGPRSLL